MALRLRPLAATDRDLYVRWITDPAAAEWSPVENPDAEFDRATRSRYNFVVEDDGSPVGAVAVEGNWDAVEPVVELGIVMDARHRRRGLGMRAARLVLATAFDELGAHRIVHGVYRENDGVVEFFRRIGFDEDSDGPAGPDGRPAVHFSLTRRDWANRRQLSVGDG